MSPRVTDAGSQSSLSHRSRREMQPGPWFNEASNDDVKVNFHINTELNRDLQSRRTTTYIIVPRGTMDKVVEFHMMDKSKYFPLALTSGFIVRTILYPFNLVKTRLQIQRHNSSYSGTLDAFRCITQREGYVGLYRGFWVNNVNVASQLLYVTTYECVRRHLATETAITDKRRRAFIAGGFASLAAQTVVVPIDVVSQHLQTLSMENKRTAFGVSNVDDGVVVNARTKFQINVEMATSSNGENLSNRGLETVELDTRHCEERISQHASVRSDRSLFALHGSDAARIKEHSRLGAARLVVSTLFQRDGLPGFYRGYLVSVMTYAPASALWWFFYDSYCDVLAHISPAAFPHLLLQCIAAPVAGSSSVLLTTPMDAIRARIQVENSRFVDTARTLWREERMRIFTKGLSPRLVQSVFTSFFVVLGYETIKRLSLLDEYKEAVRW